MNKTISEYGVQYQSVPKEKKVVFDFEDKRNIIKVNRLIVFILLLLSLFGVPYILSYLR